MRRKTINAIITTLNRKELKVNAGTQFDPNLIRIFIEKVSEESF